MPLLGQARRDRSQADPLLRAALRVLRVGRRTGLAGQALGIGLPRMLVRAARRGLNVRSLHTLHAALDPQRPALVDAGRTLTYGELDREINRVANGLRRLGVGRGPVVLAMENRAEYLVAWFAVFRLGVPSVHASWHSTAEELGYRIENSGARVVFVSDRTAEAVERLRARRPDLQVRVVRVDSGPHCDVPYEELATSGSRRFPRRRTRGGASVVYTSGTTGRPKGALRDFARFGLLELSRVLERLPLAAGERNLLVAPMYHSAGQVFTLLETALGATIYIRRELDAEGVLRGLSEHGIESVFMVPTMIRRVVELPDALHRRWPTPHLRALVSGAAPFPHDLRRAAVARFGECNVYDFYGATELGWVTLVRGDEMMARPGSVGRPIAGQHVRILDDGGGEVPTGDAGVIHVRGEQLMHGYVGHPPTSRAARRPGWLTVDDIGRLDADDYLYIEGRARDMIISGGVNVYPIEVEEVLAQHPDLAEVAVVGLPDETWGERVAAFVVPRREVDLEAVGGWAREHLSAHKRPKQWLVVDALPRNPTGKVLKEKLKEKLEARATG